MKIQKLVLTMTALSISAASLGHGLISEPPSRNWLCGATTKPHEAPPSSACGQAFAGDMNGGYQFMSVLTHDVGRKGVTPLPGNVCGFDSETWNGGATPWDKAIDWPTNAMTAGFKTITWDISWGPHYDDTEEFRYWITKPDFQFQVGQPLTWNDFETEAFCVINYDDKNPTANPNAIPDKDNALFHTVCDIPQRIGRHVIYAEWGRNQWTYERFHGCIDASFSGGGEPNPVVAAITATPSGNNFTGAGTIQLSAAASTGNNLVYQWSIDSVNPALYSLSTTTAANTSLTLANPLAESNLTVRLLVSSGGSVSNAALAITHSPEVAGSWADMGALSTEARALEVGDKVNLRLVRQNGQDVYIPSTPLHITTANQASTEWTYALAQAVNLSAADVQVGVLDSNDTVTPIQSATANRIYAQLPSGYVSVFLNIQQNGSSSSSSSTSSASSVSSVGPSPAGNCEYIISNEWNTGFTATIRVTNNGTTAINGWTVNWEYADQSLVSNAWNVVFSGTNPYAASNLAWNASILPGDSVEFGFQGTKGAGSASIPLVTGNVCGS